MIIFYDGIKLNFRPLIRVVIFACFFCHLNFVKADENDFWQDEGKYDDILEDFEKYSPKKVQQTLLAFPKISSSAVVYRSKSERAFFPFIYRSAEGDLPFRLYMPEGELSLRKLPMVVYLHGSLARGSDNSRQIRESILLLGNKYFQKRNPCFVLVPQCPKKRAWDFEMATEVANLSSSLASAIDEIDKRRVYIMGHSLGGFGVCSVLRKKPDVFAAAMPISGAFPDVMRSDSLPPTMVIYAKNDFWAVRESSKEMAEALSFSGQEVYAWEVKNASHSDTLKRTLKRKSVMNWLFAQIR